MYTETQQLHSLKWMILMLPNICARLNEAFNKARLVPCKRLFVRGNVGDDGLPEVRLPCKHGILVVYA